MIPKEAIRGILAQSDSALADMYSGWSEATYCAGWMDGEEPTFAAGLLGGDVAGSVVAPLEDYEKEGIATIRRILQEALMPSPFETVRDHFGPDGMGSKELCTCTCHDETYLSQGLCECGHKANTRGTVLNPKHPMLLAFWEECAKRIPGRHKLGPHIQCPKCHGSGWQHRTREAAALDLLDAYDEISQQKFNHIDLIAEWQPNGKRTWCARLHNFDTDGVDVGGGNNWLDALCAALMAKEGI